MKQNRPGETTHGMTGTALHRCWKNMKSRCNNESSSRFYRYGARGITYCGDWESFSGFMRWSLNNGYKEGLTLDRVDVDGNYCPENCRWVTYEENHNLMMSDNLDKGTGIFSKESKEKSTEVLRNTFGKTTKVSKDDCEVIFNSRGEAVEYLCSKLKRGKPSVKSQVTLCLKGKCKTIGGYEVYE